MSTRSEDHHSHSRSSESTCSYIGPRAMFDAASTRLCCRCRTERMLYVQLPRWRALEPAAVSESHLLMHPISNLSAIATVRRRQGRNWNMFNALQGAELPFNKVLTDKTGRKDQYSHFEASNELFPLSDSPSDTFNDYASTVRCSRLVSCL